MIGKLHASTLLLILISSLFITAAIVLTDTPDIQNKELTDNINIKINEFLPSEGVQRNIRIAIYNEPSHALPSYAPAGTVTNNFVVVQGILESEGYDTDVLQYIEIIDHQLTTANYDVFIIVDSLPRDDIAYLVKDFWLGGGSILSFNTAIGYLCQFGFFSGIEGDYGMVGHSGNAMWMYNAFDEGTINARHPAAKDYHIGDAVTAILDSRVIVNKVGLTGIIGEDYADLAHDADDVGDGIAFAVDNHRFGGKIVHLPGNCSTIPTWIQNILPDTLDWLTPRPKARILFDLSHDQFVGIDEWDPPAQPYYLSEWRNAIVNRSYTLDKLHPSDEGNLTWANLVPYDMLVISLPDLNFSIQEVANIQSWITGGGSLLIITEGVGLANQYLVRANQILEPTGISYNRSNGFFDGTGVKVDDHPILEECSSLSYFFGSLLNLSGNAIPLWEDGAGNYLVAASEYGDGRVIATGDISCLLNGWIETEDNLQFVMNEVNWLTSSKAQVLLYTTEPDASNYYRTPAADALNDLGISFYLTGESPYMNLSLHQYSWTLAILDGPYGAMSAYYDDIQDYVIAGGKLIMSDYQVDNYPTHSLWTTLGFEYASDAPGLAPLYIREFSSDVFQVPNNYVASNFTPYRTYGDEGDQLTVLGTATALAYYTDDYQTGTAAIILRDDEQTLYNGYLIDQFQGDLDDSTYMDAFELWENEIAYMLQPSIDHPSDIEYTEGETGNTIVWHGVSLLPWEYSVRRDSDDLYTHSWDGETIVVSVDGLTNGTYQYYMEIVDKVGQWRTDVVIVTVHEEIETTPIDSFTLGTVTTTNGTAISESFVMIVLIIVGTAAIVIVLVLIVRKRSNYY